MDVRCPHCDTEIEVGKTAYGKVKPCPECGEPFRIPFPRAREGRGRRTAPPSVMTNVVMLMLMMGVLGVSLVLAVLWLVG